VDCLQTVLKIKINLKGVIMFFDKTKIIKWGVFVSLAVFLSLFNSNIAKAQDNNLDIDQLLSISSQISGDVQ
jgi:hypothetical protein